LRSAVEPLVHAPETVESARISGIGVVDDAVLEHECAHARPVAMVRTHVGSAHRCESGLCVRSAALLTRPPLKCDFPPIVVFNLALAFLLLRERDGEVEIEVAVRRGCPWKRPAQSLLVCLQLCKRRT